MTGNAWRSVIAVLANDDTRRMLARLLLGESLHSVTAGLPAGRRRSIVRALERSGLIDAETGALRERLAAFSDDTAVLRRYLVDHGLAERRADGSQYALVAELPT